MLRTVLAVPASHISPRPPAAGGTVLLTGSAQPIRSVGEAQSSGGAVGGAVAGREGGLGGGGGGLLIYFLRVFLSFILKSCVGFVFTETRSLGKAVQLYMHLRACEEKGNSPDQSAGRRLRTCRESVSDPHCFWCSFTAATATVPRCPGSPPSSATLWKDGPSATSRCVHVS